MSTFLLIDTSNLFHRCLHAGTGDIGIRLGMSLHIAFNSIKFCSQKFNIDHVVFCVDNGSWRTKVYPKYKAHRRIAEQARSLKEQRDRETYFEGMKEFLNFISEKTNASVLSAQDVEGDDFVARWIQLHPSDDHVIISTDKDYHQLLSSNVKIYDGINNRTITLENILDDKGNEVKIKRTRKKKNSLGQMAAVTTEETLKSPDPEYSLFCKIIRGDPSDNIMSSFPGAREKGTKNKPGIREAFDDRTKQGYNWSNFMYSEWDKIDGFDENQQAIKTRVVVKDEFAFNERLIDLTKQPDDIKELMDSVILREVEKTPKSQVGIYFLQFAETMDLKNIAKNPTEYVKPLAKTYVKR